MHWNSQSSGIVIDPEIARPLEQEWGRRVGSLFEPTADEILDVDFPEQAAHIAVLNSYERSGFARAACLDHYGHRCFVCQLDFAETYGKEGAGLIQVHHVVPISAINKNYRVDPGADLRPVCPNCHAVIHRREPPYEIDEVRKFLVEARVHQSKGDSHVDSNDRDHELRVDPVERSHQYLASLETVHARAQAFLEEHELAGCLGSCHAFWREKKRILREDYGIDWRSPSEMNPFVMFD